MEAESAGHDKWLPEQMNVGLLLNHCNVKIYFWLLSADVCCVIRLK